MSEAQVEIDRETGALTMAGPVLPYAGTSGWSGTDTSRERAETADKDGTTAKRQGEVLSLVAEAKTYGATVKEIRYMGDLHHGQASSVLSNLHKVGKLALLTERRQRCHVYVLPEHVNGRETVEHKANKPPTPSPETTAVLQVLRYLDYAEARDVRLVSTASVRRIIEGGNV